MIDILSGIDRAETEKKLLSSGRLGLMTNPTGITRDFQSTIDVLREKYRLCALFAVEHGIRGSVQAGETVAAATDTRTGLPVWPVYGNTRRLTGDMLEQFDIFCFDMQDVGARFYTYLYALSFAMEECAKAGKPVVVFDRINPLGGELIQGTVLNPAFASYVGMYPLPTRAGLTIGEYARWVRDYLRLDGLDLRVVPMTGWKRNARPEDLRMPWPAPSPNCPSFHAARAYIGTCIFEGCNVSEGRGTALPFEYIGTPWMDGEKLADSFRNQKLLGIHFRPAWFTPTFSKFAGQVCSGVQMHITDPCRADPIAAALDLMDRIREMYPKQFAWTEPAEGTWHIDHLLGTDDYRTGQLDGKALLNRDAEARERFRQERTPYLLYS